MKYLILSLLLTSCAEVATSKRITTTTFKCPNGYIYNQKDGLCHQLPKYVPIEPLEPLNDDSISIPKKTKKRRVEHKQIKINCQKVFEEMNQCQIER